MLFILNPAAGNGRSQQIMEKLKIIMDNRSITYSIVPTLYPGHATLLAREAVEKGCSAVISVGGDGTLYEVVNGLAGSQATLGIIPAGTGNDFLYALRLPTSPKKALDIILSGKKRSIDIGTANQGLFINVAGTGFDADVLLTASHIKKWIGGKSAYLLAVLYTLLHFDFKDVIIQIDGQFLQRRILMAAVANGNCYGGGMRVAPLASVSDGKLDVCIVSYLPKWRIPFLLPLFMKGKHLKLPFVEYYKAEHVKISSLSSFPLNIDGELAGITPLECSIIPNQISVFVP